MVGGGGCYTVAGVGSASGHSVSPRSHLRARGLGVVERLVGAQSWRRQLEAVRGGEGGGKGAELLQLGGGAYIDVL
jgi:hypothetical protein